MEKKSGISAVLFGSILCVFLFTSMVGYANFDDNDHELAITEKRYADALAILKR